MLGQPEDGRTAILTGVAADSLKHADPVVQGVSQDMDLSLGPGNQRAIHPNLTVVHRLLLRKSFLQIRTPGQSQPEAAGLRQRVETETAPPLSISVSISVSASISVSVSISVSLLYLLTCRLRGKGEGIRWLKSWSLSQSFLWLPSASRAG